MSFFIDLHIKPIPQIFEEIASLSFQVSWTHQFLTKVKTNLDSEIFPLGLSNFGWGAWFPFDKGQSTAWLYAHFDIFQKSNRNQIKQFFLHFNPIFDWLQDLDVIQFLILREGRLWGGVEYAFIRSSVLQALRLVYCYLKKPFKLYIELL